MKYAGQQALIGGIHYGIYRELGDVTGPDFDHERYMNS